MSARYRVACTCGQSVLVGEAQAGSTVSCACGATLTAPMLRDLRKLPREEVPASVVQRADRPAGGHVWSSRQAILFVLGVATALSLVVTAVLYVGRSRLNASWSPEIQKFVDDHFIDELEPAMMLGAFAELRTHGLGEAQPTTVMLNRETYYRLAEYLRWSGGVSAVLAVAWLGIAVATKPKSRPA